MLELLINPIASLLDKVIPDKDQRDKLAHEIATMSQKQGYELAKAQIAVNQVEAGHRSIFVAGWRPALGWVGVSAIAYNYVLLPLINIYLVSNSMDVLSPMDLSELMPLILGMLGLGGYRTYEKKKGVAK
jgi:hypothetical protein